jgi:TonB family protein
MKAIHYLSFSLVVHAGLAILFLLLRSPQPARLEQSRVILDLRPVNRQVSPEPVPRAANEAGPGSSAVSLFSPGEDIPAPAPAPAGRTQTAARSERVSTGDDGVLPAPAPEMNIILPAPAAVLEEVLARGASSPPRRPAARAGEPDLVWSGSGRRLLKQGDLYFPDILLQEAQEVDVEASFLVSPDGRVTQIEITRSSGYILVDRAIERALYEYLFEGSATGEMETGLIRFRFRLERVD